MSVELLLQALNGSLSAVKDERVAAEQVLNEWRLKDGFLQNLLAVVSREDMEAALRVSAAIVLKNEVRYRWRDDDDKATKIEYSEAERSAIRRSILSGMARIDVNAANFRKQLDETLYQIVLQDFPTQWPQAGEVVVSALQQRENLQDVAVGLTLLRKIARKYEMTLTKDEEIQVAFTPLVEMAGPLCLQIVESLGDQIYATPINAFITKMVCKVYWSVTNISLVKSTYIHGSQAQWMQLLRHVIMTPIQEDPNLVQDDALFEKQYACKAKKWALQCLRRFVIRFAPARRTNNGEEKNPFALEFMDKHAVVFMNDMLLLQSRISAARFAAPNTVPAGFPTRLQTLVLEYLSNCVSFSAGYKAMKPHIESLITQAVYPMLSYDAADAENWEIDPSQVFKSGTQLFDVINTPRDAAASLLRNVMRLRGKDFLQPVCQFVQSTLETYQQAPAEAKGPFSNMSRAKDGALVILGEICDRLTSKKRQLQLETLVYQHVIPELHEGVTDQFLRMRAAWVVGRIFDPATNVLAKEGRLSDPPRFTELFSAIVRTLRSDALPIKMAAVSSLRTFFQIPLPTLREFVAQHTMEIVDVILAMVELREMAEAAVPALHQLISHYESEVSPFSARLLEFMTKSFVRMVAPDSEHEKSEPGSPFSMASAVQDDETVVMTAYDVCRTINSLLEILSQNEDLDVLDSCVPILIPVLDLCLSAGGIDFLEDGLQMLSYLTFQPKTWNPVFWRYYDRMYQATCGGNIPGAVIPQTLIDGYASDEFKTMLAPLDNYFAQCPTGFATGVSESYKIPYKIMALNMVKKVAPGDCDPDGPICAAQMLYMIADAFVENIAPISDIVPEMVSITLQLLAQGHAGQTSEDDFQPPPLSKSGREAAIKTLCCILYADPANFFSLCTSQNVLGAVLGYCTETKNLKSLESVKVFLLSWFKVLRMARANSLALPQELTQPAASQGLLKLLVEQTIHMAAMRKEADEAKEDDDSDYSYDSEQELEDDEDAAAQTWIPSAVLKELEPDNDEDDTDDEYDVDLDQELGVRVSPLDAYDEMVVSQNFFRECTDAVSAVLGQQDAGQLAAAIEREITRTEQKRAAAKK